MKTLFSELVLQNVRSTFFVLELVFQRFSLLWASLEASLGVALRLLGASRSILGISRRLWGLFGMSLDGLGPWGVLWPSWPSFGP